MYKNIQSIIFVVFFIVATSVATAQDFQAVADSSSATVQISSSHEEELTASQRQQIRESFSDLFGEEDPQAHVACRIDRPQDCMAANK